MRICFFGRLLKNKNLYVYRWDKQGKNTEFLNTKSTGNLKSHNNMHPYLTANCWKRIG